MARISIVEEKIICSGCQEIYIIRWVFNEFMQLGIFLIILRQYQDIKIKILEHLNCCMGGKVNGNV